MGALPQTRSSTSTPRSISQLKCPEDVDWMFDIDSLQSAGGDSLIRVYALEEAPRDCPHYPFSLSSNSAVIWEKTIRHLSMASGESHLVLTAHSHKEAGEVVFYTRVAGFREGGLPRIAATFQKIDQSSYQTVSDNVRQNWLYMLHEIKNPLSILKAAEDLEFSEGDQATARAEAAQTRRFAVSCLEDHLRNGVFLATEDSKMIPNRPEPLDLQLLLEDIRDTFDVVLRSRGNRIELKLDIEAHRVIRLDRTLLSQLLNNLLLNKINLLENKVLTISCSFSSSRTDGSGILLVIAIEDEGPAFPEHVLQNFDQEPDVEGLLQIQKNSGLGLPICRRIASVMGGELTFFNDPPKTRIRLMLPIG